MITCPNCSKANQDHYKFCLACGTKLPGPVAGPPPEAEPPGPPPPLPEVLAAVEPSEAFAEPSLPEPLDFPPEVEGAPYAAPLPQPDATPYPPPPEVAPPSPPPTFGRASPPRTEMGPPAVPPSQAPTAAAGAGCPSCDFVNPSGFKFCGRCGTPLAATPEAGTPRPLPTTPEAGTPRPLPTTPEAGTPRPSVEDMGTARTVFVAETPDLELPTSRSAGPPVLSSRAPPPPPPSSGPSAPPISSSSFPPLSAPSDAGPSLPGSSPSLGGDVAARLVMLGPDGQPVGERQLTRGEVLEVGRSAGAPWEDDAYLDPEHASLTVTPEGLLVEDRGSLNGIFLKLQGRVEIHDGDQFRVGQELLRYEDLPEPTPTPDGTERMGSPNPGYWGRISVLADPEQASLAHPIHAEGLAIGRERGDITFPQDGYVSGRHCRIVGDDSGIYLEDLGSSNGTYVRVRSGQVVPFESLILVGQKLFQVERPA